MDIIIISSILFQGNEIILFLLVKHSVIHQAKYYELYRLKRPLHIILLYKGDFITGYMYSPYSVFPGAFAGPSSGHMFLFVLEILLGTDFCSTYKQMLYSTTESEYRPKY